MSDANRLTSMKFWEDEEPFAMGMVHLVVRGICQGREFTARTLVTKGLTHEQMTELAQGIIDRTRLEDIHECIIA